MSKRKQPQPRTGTEGILPFRVDPTPVDATITSFSGLPLVAEAFRSLGLDTSCRGHLGLEQRERGFTEGQMVESFALMLVGGGDRRDDFARLREDPGLRGLIGYVPPSPDAARRFLYAFRTRNPRPHQHPLATLGPGSCAECGISKSCSASLHVLKSGGSQMGTVGRRRARPEPASPQRQDLTER